MLSCLPCRPHCPPSCPTTLQTWVRCRRVLCNCTQLGRLCSPLQAAPAAALRCPRAVPHGPCSALFADLVAVGSPFQAKPSWLLEAFLAARPTQYRSLSFMLAVSGRVRMGIAQLDASQTTFNVSAAWVVDSFTDKVGDACRMVWRWAEMGQLLAMSNKWGGGLLHRQGGRCTPHGLEWAACLGA